jgi:hypothetical protein
VHCCSCTRSNSKTARIQTAMRCDCHRALTPCKLSPPRFLCNCHALACSPLPTLSVATATISNSGYTSNRFTCTATITIRQSGTTTPVNGAIVSLTWSVVSSLGFSGFPYSTTVATGATGVATITSSSIRSGRGCRYSVTGVTAAGYAALTVPAGSIVRSVNA